MPPVRSARPASGALDPGLTRRVSGDFWLMWRADSVSVAGPLISRYGASQAGFVARYSLGRRKHAPALYARSTAALDPFADRELAVGFAARPLARLPIRVQLEARARQRGGGVRFAPAAIAVSELRPRSLPLGFVAESYTAAGYVGGRDRTPFIDGAVRIDRAVARLGESEVRFGGGAWGGAQKGTAALDIGPRLTLATKIGGRPMRLGLDYRLRVAGDAEPRSGPALTISSGF